MQTTPHHNILWQSTWSVPQRAANAVPAIRSRCERVFIQLLRSPLHWLASKHFALLSVVGRKTGNIYEFPVRYVRNGACVTIAGHKLERWWLNLAGGADVLLLLRGKQWLGTATLATDDRALDTALRALFPRSKAECIAARLPWHVAIRVMLCAESERAAPVCKVDRHT